MTLIQTAQYLLKQGETKLFCESFLSGLISTKHIPEKAKKRYSCVDYFLIVPSTLIVGFSTTITIKLSRIIRTVKAAVV